MRFKGLGFGGKGLRDIEFRNGKEKNIERWKLDVRGDESNFGNEPNLGFSCRLFVRECRSGNEKESCNSK